MLLKLYVKPIIAGVIIFFVSIIVDKLMGKSADYGYAFMIAIFFAVFYFFIQYFLNYRIAKLRKR
jgi:ABC-type transport system involved in cytochrome c biogenesis permease component